MATADREATDREATEQTPPRPLDSSGPALPNARLNPLLNPLLAKHLGRWAHIYYTASADKREAAIENLVRELEEEENRLNNGANSGGKSQAVRDVVAVAKEAAPTPETSPLPAPPLVNEFVAPRPVEILAPSATTTHENSAQSYTGSSVDALPGVNPSEDAIFSTPEPPIPAVESVLVERLPESAPKESWHDLLRPPTSPPIFAAPSEKQKAAESEIVNQVGVQQLGVPQERVEPNRSVPPETQPAEPSDLPAFVPKIDPTVAEDYRSFDDLLAKSDAALALAIPPSPRNWRIPITIAVLAMLGAGIWFAQTRAVDHQAAKPTAVQQASAPLPEPSSASSTSSSAPASSPATVPQATPDPAPAASAAVAPPLANASEKPGETAPPVALPLLPNALPADPELAAGMRLLQGKGVQRDSTEAARHLWLSVKNQNGSALLALAGLYAQGDGVNKDCDQAKVLFDAASRQAKSSGQLQRLAVARETLQTSGCE